MVTLCDSEGKEFACNAGNQGSIPGLGKCPGEGNGNPLQYSCLENPMDKGAWQSTVHGVERVGHDLVTKSPPQFFKCLIEFTSEAFSPGLFFVDGFLITGSTSTCLFCFLLSLFW